MKVSEETSQKIKNMSTICAILVVAIHVEWPHDEFSVTWLIHHLVRDGIAHIAVPFFFAASGFFLSKHMKDKDWHSTEVKKRLHSLVVPFVVWTFIATTTIIPLSICADILAQRPFGCSLPFSNGRWIGTFGLDPRHGPNGITPLWYVRCLFCFVLIAPIFKWLVLKGKVLWLACAFALTLSHASWTPFPPYLQDSFKFGFSLSGVLYFSIGIQLGLLHGPTFSKCPFLLCSIIGPSLLIIKTVLSWHAINPHIDFVCIAIPFLMYAVWHLTPTTKWPSKLTSCTFPIFLLHMPLMPYVAIPIKHSPLCGSQLGSIIIFLVVTLASFFVTLFMRKLFHRLSTFLFAGRN